MTIETKFKVGDIVFVIDRNIVHTRTIIIVEVWANMDGINIKYKMSGVENLREYYPEDQCFSTKEELLQSL